MLKTTTPLKTMTKKISRTMKLMIKTTAMKTTTKTTMMKMTVMKTKMMKMTVMKITEMKSTVQKLMVINTNNGDNMDGRCSHWQVLMT